jgi:putative FmdB family regulatory protein
MPVYDYHCPSCGGFDALKSLSERHMPCACPDCGSPSPRVLTHAPRLSCTTAYERRAHDINERSQHAPRSSRDLDGSYGRMRHPAGCGCCQSGTQKTATVTAANGAKAFPGKRPWMISH